MRERVGFFRERVFMASLARQSAAAGLALSRAAGVGTLLGLALAGLGPFGSNSERPLVLVAYWVGTTVLAAVFIAGSRWLLSKVPVSQPGWGRTLLAGALGALPSTLVTWIATPIAFGPRPPFHTITAFWLPVTLVCLILSTADKLIPRPLRWPSPRPARGALRFSDRLPETLRGAEVYAVEAQDHYVMVHTSLGTHLLHLRLTDAIRELSGVAGERVHRSWWVSRAGVLRADRASRTWRIRLRSGADALVSRKELPKLKRGGWLDAPEGAGQ